VSEGRQRVYTAFQNVFIHQAAAPYSRFFGSVAVARQTSNSEVAGSTATRCTAR